ncbi:MAG: serine hydrolase [Roseivirga sp.]|nr:serine hydrolase [Roseivirga sp.]
MKVQRVIISSVLLVMGFIAQGQITPAELRQKVDAFFPDLENSSAPGSAILVVKGGETIINKGYGMANLENEIPIGPNTVFDLASLSKQFTGYAISTLIEQGAISENDDIRKYIPEIPVFDHTITIRHLLHHTSGLRDWTSALPLAGWSFDDVISFDHILRMVYQQEALNFTPGSKYTYSNTGYNVLAELVQRVTGQTFREWTDQNIFLPLGMNNTLFLDNHREVIANRAHGYFQDEYNDYNRAPNNLTALGSSSLYSTTTDLARWVQHLMHPTGKSKAVVARMLQTDVLNNGDHNSYASGIGIGTFRGTNWISHSGSWASFRTYLVMLPAYDLSIVVLNNHPSNTSRIARDIAALYVPAANTNNNENATGEIKEVKLPVALLNEYSGTYKLGPGWYVHLTQEDGRLWTQATNEDKFPMTAVSDHVFSIKAYGNRTMTFHKDEDGEITHLVYSGMNCPKVGKSTAPVINNAQDYTGNYFSTELNTRYKVILEQGQLKLSHLHNGDIDLKQAWGDDYSGTTWYTNSVVFQRDGNGKITGFTVSQTRAKNQYFRKEEN